MHFEFLSQSWQCLFIFVIFAEKCTSEEVEEEKQGNRLTQAH